MTRLRPQWIFPLSKTDLFDQYPGRRQQQRQHCRQWKRLVDDEVLHVWRQTFPYPHAGDHKAQQYQYGREIGLARLMATEHGGDMIGGQSSRRQRTDANS